MRIGFAVAAVALVAVTGWTPRETAYASPICVQAQNSSVIWEFMVGSAGDANIVDGVRISPTAHNVPLTGSYYVTSNGTIVVGFNTLFDYGTGTWSVPILTTVLHISGTSISYDETGYGTASAPVNFTGTATFVTCPATISGADAPSSVSSSSTSAPSGTDPFSRGAAASQSAQPSRPQTGNNDPFAH